jgi:hypothetical protein
VEEDRRDVGFCTIYKPAIIAIEDIALALPAGAKTLGHSVDQVDPM